MIDKELVLTPTQKAHAWQAHRIECVKLAISAGATCENVRQVAQDLSDYIRTKHAVRKARYGNIASNVFMLVVVGFSLVVIGTIALIQMGLIR